MKNKKNLNDNKIEENEINPPFFVDTTPAINHRNMRKGPRKNVSSIITHKYNLQDIQEYEKMKKKPILFVRNLTKKYFGKKAPAINSISFDVFPGEFHAFIGANGAGKTTTIKCLIGAYANWNGTVLINGIKNNKEDAKRKLGYIPENARFPDKFSSFKYLQWMVMLSGIPTKEAKLFAEQKLKELHMWSLRKKSPNTFSSGQKKKILLAQALIHNPDIIIMDEPVANLDPKARIEFFDLLLDLRKKGKAIFISSHVLAELDKYSNSATILDGGKIVYDGDKTKLMSLFSSHNYEVKVSNERAAIEYFHKNNITTKRDPEHDSMIVTFPKKEHIRKFQQEMIRNNVSIDLFGIIQPSLEQVYERLIVKGSVDTQKG